MSFGGQISLCLNDDGNNETSNTLVNPTPNADITLITDYETDLTIGDFYYLNFQMDNFGRFLSHPDFTDVLRNESAIVKQEVAVNLAIQMVLFKPGRDKVILMGPSMEGLASREYIQNPSNWISDANYHVA